LKTVKALPSGFDQNGFLRLVAICDGANGVVVVQIGQGVVLGFLQELAGAVASLCEIDKKRVADRHLRLPWQAADLARAVHGDDARRH
jgi:hypothetical protein